MIRKIFKKIIFDCNERVINPKLVKGKPKIFCIGRNKTGTTSLRKAFEDLNFVIGNQRRAEKLLPQYKSGNINAIINYCKSAQVFQDFPFSYPETFKHLDKAFPNSKFILTVRDSPEQWYRSLTTFHAIKFGNGSIPTQGDLQKAPYVWKGWLWECNRIIYKTPESDPYNKEILIKSYIDYNNSVINYFRNRPNDFIVINLSDKGSYNKLMSFLEIDSPFFDFPWENKTQTKKT